MNLVMTLVLISFHPDIVPFFSMVFNQLANVESMGNSRALLRVGNHYEKERTSFFKTFEVFNAGCYALLSRQPTFQMWRRSHNILRTRNNASATKIVNPIRFARILELNPSHGAQNGCANSSTMEDLLNEWVGNLARLRGRDDPRAA